MNPAYSAPREHLPLVETYEIVITVFVLAGGWFAWYLARGRYHMTGRQVAELACYLAVVVTVLYSTAYRLLTKRSRREREWPHPPLVVRPSADDRATQKAWNQSAVVLGYNVHGEFFGKHQLNYLADIVRVLAYTGLKFNFYDVLVMAIDEQALREQVTKASRRLEQDTSISTQRKLNFEMSVKNLYQSFQDRERVPKIQGLLNECMTFLDDELSIITGP